MVLDSIPGEVWGVVGALLGYGISEVGNYITTKQQIGAQQDQLRTQLETENQRRRAEFYLEKKVDVLMELHAVMTATRRMLKRDADAASIESLSEERLQDVMDQFHEFQSKKDRAAVFLDDEQQSVLNEVLSIIMEVNFHLAHSIDNPGDVEQYNFGEHGLSEFNSRFDAAEEMIQEEVKTPIDELAEGLD